jgi:hypothetical protein
MRASLDSIGEVRSDKLPVIRGPVATAHLTVQSSRWRCSTPVAVH